MITVAVVVVVVVAACRARMMSWTLGQEAKDVVGGVVLLDNDLTSFGRFTPCCCPSKIGFVRIWSAGVLWDSWMWCSLRRITLCCCDVIMLWLFLNMGLSNLHSYPSAKPWPSRLIESRTPKQYNR